MGIDIYAKWRGQTDKEKKAQYTGFSAVAGSVGYLREAYSRSPFATRFFVAEAFIDGADDVKIPAEVLRSRLPETLKLVAERYKEHDAEEIKEYQKAYEDFVELCEKKEKETGEAVDIMASY